MSGKSTYKDEYAKSAVQICELGATIPELAEAIGVCRSTIYSWANSNPAFAYAIKVGKKHADDRVERSMYQKAVGYTVVETKRQYGIVKNADGTETLVLEKEHVTEKQLPPDTVAGIFWLKNRVPDAWRDRREFTGADGESLLPENVSHRDLAIRLLSMIEGATEADHPKPH